MLKLILATFFVVTSLCPMLSSADTRQDKMDKQLLKAVNKGKLRQFNKLLKQGANPNRIFSENISKHVDDWVMCAVTRMGNHEFLISVSNLGGDLNLRNPFTAKSSVKSIFSAPLLCAIRHHNDRAFNYLLERDVTIDIIACTQCRYERHRGSAVFS